MLKNIGGMNDNLIGNEKSDKFMISFSFRLIGWGQIRSGATIQPSVPEDRSVPIK